MAHLEPEASAGDRPAAAGGPGAHAVCRAGFARHLQSRALPAGDQLARQRRVGRTEPPRTGTAPGAVALGRQQRLGRRRRVGSQPLPALVRVHKPPDQRVVRGGRVPGRGRRAGLRQPTHAAVVGQRQQHAAGCRAAGARQAVQPARRDQVEQRRAGHQVRVRHCGEPFARQVAAHARHRAVRPARGGGARQQRGVVVQERPGLRLRQPRRQVAQVGAGAAAEVQHAPPAARLPRGAQRGQQLCRAGAVVGRLAQREPVGTERLGPVAHRSGCARPAAGAAVSASSAAPNVSAAVSQSGRPAA